MGRGMAALAGWLAFLVLYWWSPAQARFLQPDPVGYQDDMDLYTYVGNAPTDNTDPTGKFLWPWEKAVTVTGGTPQQRDHYAQIVQKVLSTPRGQQLNSEIVGPWYEHGRPQEISLQPGIKYGTGAEMEKYDDGRIVSRNKVDIDPNFHPLVQTTAGAIPLTDERVVGHELGHSVTGTLDNGPGQMNNVNQNENPIVRALGQPARTQYGPPGDASGAHVSNAPSFSSHPTFKQCAVAGISCGGGVDIIP